jgi:hypothetical protein
MKPRRASPFGSFREKSKKLRRNILFFLKKEPKTVALRAVCGKKNTCPAYEMKPRRASPFGSFREKNKTLRRNILFLLEKEPKTMAQRAVGGKKKKKHMF